MSNHLGSYFRDQRIEQGLSLGQLARLVGYRNVSKGADKIVRLERQGQVTEELLARLAETLRIDLPTVEDLIDRDHQERLREWEAWVSQPVPMRLIVKYIPGVYGTVQLPEEITTPEQAEAFACAYAKEYRRQVCLAVSRRLSIWIDREGQVYARTEATPGCPNTPLMRLRGTGRTFLFGLASIAQHKA
jgi:transcriptional regulator with XRE-family HTH domain